jgi:hypothetical protein
MSSASPQPVWCTTRTRAVHIGLVQRGAARAAIVGPIGGVADISDNAGMESPVELDNSEVIDKHSTFNGGAELNGEITGCAVHTAASGRTGPALPDRAAV